MTHHGTIIQIEIIDIGFPIPFREAHVGKMSEPLSAA
jgi:hypothetical protein